MSTSIKQARRGFDKQLDRKADTKDYDPGVMADIEGIGSPRVSTLVNHAYIIIGDEEVAAKVLNRKVPYITEQAVWVGEDPVDGIYQVMGQRAAPYLGSGQNYYPPVPEHHISHEFEAYGENGGYDLTWISWEQITTLAVLPAPTLGPFWVELREGPMPRGTGWVWISAANGNVVTLNLAADVPGAGGLAALMYIDADGDLQRRLSGIVGIGALDITLTPSPNTGEFPVASVFLYSTQANIQHNYTTQDITQLRYPQFGPAGEDQLGAGNRKLIELGY